MQSALERLWWQFVSRLPLRLELWLKWRSANTAITGLNHDFRPRIEAARWKRDEEEAQRLERELAFRKAEYTDELWAMESRALVEKARRLDVHLEDMPADDVGGEYWVHGALDEFLRPEARHFLNGRIREERGARWKTRRVVWTLLISFLFGLLGIALTIYNSAKSSREERMIDALQREVDAQSKRISIIEQRPAQVAGSSGAESPRTSPTKRAKKTSKRRK